MKAPEPVPMTAGELRGVMADLRLTYDETALLVGLSKSGISKWLFESKPSKNMAAVVLLRYLRKNPGMIDEFLALKAEPGEEVEPRPMKKAPEKKS